MDPILMDGVDSKAAQELQDGLDLLNKVSPVQFVVPWFLANPRHECTGARQSKSLAGKGVSTALDAKERYVTGWVKQEDPLDVKPVFDPEAKLAIIYREGVCKKCRQVARSEAGRVVLTAERPPVEGRVARD